MNNVYCKVECTTVTDVGGTDASPCEILRNQTCLEHIESAYKSPPPSS